MGKVGYCALRFRRRVLDPSHTPLEWPHVPDSETVRREPVSRLSTQPPYGKEDST